MSTADTRSRPLLFPLLGLLGSLVVVKPLAAGETSLRIGTDTRIHVSMRSLKSLRDRDLVRQTYDYSCGAAALATLLTYGLGDDATERDILLEVLATLSEDEEAARKKEGLSLLDLQRVAHARGHKAHGFRLAPEFLAKLRGPVMVFIKPRGYEHFAVLKGIRGDRAYLADPSRGNVRMPMYKFLAMWRDETGKGIIFVVERAESGEQTHSLLQPPAHDGPYAEVLSARQLLEVTSPAAATPRFLSLAR